MFDLHNHMLPELDDGATDWAESLSMARMAAEDGIEGVVCTPHWVYGFFENGRTRILETIKTLQEKIAQDSIPLTVYPGAELRLHHDISKKIESKEVLTLNDTGRYALIELPDEVLPQHLEHFFWDLQLQGVTPVISHPERNAQLILEPRRLARLVEMGSLLQVTAASVRGRFGSAVQNFALQLLEHRLVHVLATDAHGLDMRTPRLSRCYETVAGLLGEDTARRLMHENPKRIVRGEPISPVEPIPWGSVKRRSSTWGRISSFFGFKSR